MVETIGSKWVRKEFDFQFCWKRKAEAKNPEKCYYFFGNNRPNLNKQRNVILYFDHMLFYEANETYNLKHR